MKKRINIAIDGYSGCGKSSTAKVVAKALNYTYIDTGAMYRAVTLYFLDHQICIESPEHVQEALDQIHIEFRFVSENESAHTFLNGEDVDEKIRALRVSNFVSPVSTLSVVRKALVAQQQRMGIDKGVVMDGRDIGTVVFPDAELKIFMTANPQVRAKRRKAELAQKGIDAAVEEIEDNLLERDRIDSSRADSPLKMADGAFLVDTSDISFDDQVAFILAKAHEIIGAQKSGSSFNFIYNIRVQ
jgi:cytidylate kinase